MATWTIASTFVIQVGTVTTSDITVSYLAGKDFTNDGSVDAYLNSMRLNLTPTVTPAIGQMYWDTEHSCPAIKMNANVTAQIPLENLVLAVNKTGSEIPDGKVVYISGAQGNRPTIALAQSDALTTSQIIGVTTEAIANNAEGWVTINGEVHEYDTSGFTEGDVLYVSASTAGLITNVAPVSPNYLVVVGTALNSTAAGKILISPKYPIALDTSLTLDSDLVVPSQKAVKAYASDITINKLNASLKTRVTANVVTSYAIDRDLGSVFELTMTGATTFTDSNLATGTDTEDIFVILTGNFVPTFPVYWEATPDSEAFDGTVRNLIKVSTINGTVSSEDVLYEIQNLTT